MRLSTVLSAVLALLVAATMAQAFDRELVSNSGFEVDNWGMAPINAAQDGATFDGTSFSKWITEDVIGGGSGPGDWARKTDGLGAGGSTAYASYNLNGWYGTLYEVVPGTAVTPGTITLTFDYKRNVLDESFWTALRIYGTDTLPADVGDTSMNSAGVTRMVSYTSSMGLPNTDQWTTMTATANTAAAFKYYVIRVWCENTGVDQFQLDNMSVKTTAVAGDASGDLKVSVGDLGILAANYGNNTGLATWEMGDFNGDGNVSVGDLGILAANYGFGSAAPEPLSLGLLGLGALALRRR